MTEIIKGEIVFVAAEYILLFIICVIDIKKKIISDKCVLMLFLLGIVNSVLKKEAENYYLGICVYTMPMLFLYTAEDFFNKEFIGFGDIKLMMALGGRIQSEIPEIMKEKIIYSVFSFYRYLYTISGTFALLLIIFIKIYNIKSRNKTDINIKYLPFAPFIIITYTITILRSRWGI